MTRPTSATDSLRNGIAQPVSGICAPECATGSRDGTNQASMAMTGATRHGIGLGALRDRQDAARDREQAARDRDLAKRRDGAGPGEGTGEFGEDGQVGVEPDPLDSPDSER